MKRLHQWSCVLVTIAVLTAGCAPAETTAGGYAEETMTDYERPSDEDLEESLSPMQYKVARCSGTEPPFNNEYWDNKEPGLYVDVVSGEPLFSSLDKYNSGSGWPSFTKPLKSENVVNIEDRTHGMTRVEVRSKGADSHLGHVFPDGPGPSGLRYCVNSASMRFVPVDRLEREGYGEYLMAFAQAGVIPLEDVPARTDRQASAGREEAILAAGCFWGVEHLFRELDGVIETEVGYTGGDVENPSYRQVTTGRTGHAEAVRIVFDPSRTSYEEILDFFFRLHDPTTMNRQHNDVGTQYRSAIFVVNERQRQTAEAVVQRVGRSGAFEDPIVTGVVDAGAFWSAEEYHQDYLVTNPSGYMCHVVRES